MTAEDFRPFPQVQTERRRFEVAGLDFTKAMDTAIGRATQGIENPNANEVVHSVVWQLLKLFDKYMEEKTPTTRFGRIRQWLAKLIKL